MFGIKGRDTFNKPTSDVEEVLNKFHTIWLKYFKYLLLILLVINICIIGYIWYKYLYGKNITEKEKQEYIIKKKAEVTFKKKQFDELKQKALVRREKFEEEYSEQKDIFYRENDIEITSE